MYKCFALIVEFHAYKVQSFAINVVKKCQQTRKQYQHLNQHLVALCTSFPFLDKPMFLSFLLRVRTCITMPCFLKSSVKVAYG